MARKSSKPRRHIVKTRPNTWQRRGFLPSEVYRLTEISREGMKSDFIQKMIRQRISLKANAARYNWTPAEYQRRVALLYEKQGVRAKRRGESYAGYIDKQFYNYFTALQRAYSPEGVYNRRKQERRRKPVTKTTAGKRRQLEQKIAGLNSDIGRVSIRNDQKMREKLERQRNRLQMQLDGMR